jgi:hypothetical protein
MWIPLTKNSLGVVKNNPKLLVFPVLSGFVWLIFLGGIGRAVLEVGLSTLENPPVIGALFIGVYLGSVLVFTFFAAGLVHETRDVLADGSKPSLWTGLTAAWHTKVPVLVWSVIGTAVRVAISALTRRSGAERRKNRNWSRKTFFIVPVMVFERPGVGEMFFESDDSISQMREKKRINFFGLELIGLYFVIPSAVLGLLVVSVSEITNLPSLLGPSGIVVIALFVAAGFLVSQTVLGIIKTGLYLYATEDTLPAAFESIDFQ